MPKTKAELEQTYLHHQTAMQDAMLEARNLLNAIYASNEPIATKVSELENVTNLVSNAAYHGHRMIVHRRLIESAKDR